MLSESLMLSAIPMISSPATIAARGAVATSNPTMIPRLVTIAEVLPKL
jgi:hypothetical protein